MPNRETLSETGGSLFPPEPGSPSSLDAAPERFEPSPSVDVNGTPQRRRCSPFLSLAIIGASFAPKCIRLRIGDPASVPMTVGRRRRGRIDPLGIRAAWIDLGRLHRGILDVAQDHLGRDELVHEARYTAPRSSRI